MKQDNGTFGLLVGGIVALAAMFFIFGGGELGGKTVINGDEDLPPIVRERRAAEADDRERRAEIAGRLTTTLAA